jgi:hypothetical protein
VPPSYFGINNKEIKMDTANQIIYAYGAGRDHRTKYDRRMGRFLARQFRVGEVVIRPGRRVPVTMQFLAGHADEIVRHIDRGALRLQSHADAFLTTSEFRALLRGESLVKTAPLTAAPDDDGPGEETYEDTGGDSPAEDFNESEPEAFDEPSDSDLAHEQEPALSDEPMEETPDVTSEEMAYMAGAALPDGWRMRNKRGLLLLCVERQVAADDKMSNNTIIQMLADWEKAQAAR